MIDHVGLAVSDLAASRRFYEAALAPLGYRVLFDGEGFVGLGDSAPDLWLEVGEPRPVHVALRAAHRRDVDAFHAAALAAGGTDHGAPGLRPHYGPSYYAAFVHDLDGHNIEAVCHAPG